MSKLFTILCLLLPCALFGQDSVSVARNKPLSKVRILELSDREIPYKDRDQSTMYTYFGPSMNGPQYFLILKEDSTFTWDAWHGSDSFISAGNYRFHKDTLVPTGNEQHTKAFEKAYRKAKPQWKWYNTITIHKKLLVVERGAESGQLMKLQLIKMPRKD